MWDLREIGGVLWGGDLGVCCGVLGLGCFDRGVVEQSAAHNLQEEDLGRKQARLWKRI